MSKFFCDMRTVALPSMHSIIQAHRTLWKQRDFRIRAISAIGFVAFSCVVSYYAGQQATASASVSNWVEDIFLSNFPRMETTQLHVSASWIIVGLITVLLLIHPRFAPAVCKSVALIILTRAAFINMTHLGVYPDAGAIEGSLFTFGGDLFYSNHTAIPILLGFLFYEFRWLRNPLFLLGVFFGINALLGHLHYTIDVFMAPFFAFTIYEVSKRLFKKDFAYIRAISS